MCHSGAQPAMGCRQIREGAWELDGHGSGGSSMQTSNSTRLPQPLHRLIWLSSRHTAAQEERRAIQSPHTDITEQVCSCTSKFLSQMEEGTTQSDTGWESPAKIGVLQHCQKKQLSCHCQGIFWAASDTSEPLGTIKLQGQKTTFHREKAP